ncbi:MAG: cysteine peptidase family C39 domain-containing protein [Candidatus Hydrogenedentes bacterium]|nr:cysteine peptidase family C39 domain-containing protein [Candidatus Hydrogenedentota bacterium]
MSMLTRHRLFFRFVSLFVVATFLPTSVQAWHFFPQVPNVLMAAEDGPEPLAADKLDLLAANTDGAGAPLPLSDAKRKQLADGATAPTQLAQAEGIVPGLNLAITPDPQSAKPNTTNPTPESGNAPKPNYVAVPNTRKPLPNVDAFIANLQLPEEERIAQSKVLLAQASEAAGLLTGGFDKLYYLASPDTTPAAGALIAANDLLKTGKHKDALLGVLDVMEGHTRTAPVIDAQTQFNEVFDAMMAKADTGDTAPIDELEAALPSTNAALLQRYQSVESRYVLQEFFQYRVTQALEADDRANIAAYASKVMDLADRTMKQDVYHTLQSDIAHYYYDTAKLVGGDTYDQAIVHLGELADVAQPTVVSWTARLLLARVHGRELRDPASAILQYGSMLGEMEGAGILNALADESAYKWLQAAIEAEIAEAYFNLGDFEPAKVHYEKTLTYPTGNEPKAEAQFNLAHIAEVQHPNTPYIAIQMYQDYINKYPTDIWTSDALLRMAGLYHIYGDYEQAVALYTEVVQNHPEKSADVTAQAAIDYIFANQWDSYEVATGIPVQDVDSSQLAKLCGPQALQKMLELQGIVSTVDGLAVAANTDDSGTTMAGLVGAAKELGLILTGVRATAVDELEAPFIAFLNDNHFVLVSEVAAAGLTIHDSGQSAVLMELSDFVSAWSGEALVASKNVELARVMSQESLEQRKGAGRGGNAPPTPKKKPPCKKKKCKDCKPGGCTGSVCKAPPPPPPPPCGGGGSSIMAPPEGDGPCGGPGKPPGQVGSPEAVSGFDSPGVSAEINTFETSLELDEGDLTLNTLSAWGLSFGRSYRSEAGFPRVETSSITKPWENNVGPGWYHRLNVHLRTSSGTTPTTVVYWDSSGAYRTYTLDSTSGGYNWYSRSATGNPDEQGDVLKRNTTTKTFTLESSGGVTENFSAATTDADLYARITSQTDAGGNVTTFEYDSTNVATGKLTKVKSPAGDAQHLALSYSGNLITKVELKKNTTVLNSVAFAYNVSNELTKVTDHASKTVDYAYDSYIYAAGSRYITKITNKAGDATDLTWTFGYSAGYKASKIDVDNVDGLTTTYDRNLTTSVCTITNLDGLTQLSKLINTPLTGNLTLSTSIDYYLDATTYERWSYEYDTDYTMTKVVAPGSVTYGTFTYNSVGNLLTEQYGNGPTATYAYDSSGQYLTKVTDSVGIETDYYYDSNNQLTKETHPSYAAAGILYAYDANGYMTRQTSPTGVYTDYEFDSLGRQTKVIQDVGGLDISSTSYYDDMGNVTRATDPRGKDTYYYYGDVSCSGCGGGGQLTKTKDALNNEAKWEYDADGLMTKSIDKANVATSVEYDSMRRVTKSTFPSGGANYGTVAYDLFGRITSITRSGGHTVSFTHDHLGRTTTMSDSVGDIDSSYSSLGLLSTVTDSQGHTTTSEYDGAFRMTKVTDAIGKSTVYVYDSYGRITKVGAGASGTIDPTTYFFDNTTGMLTKTEHNSGSYAANYYYDDDTQLTKITDWLDGTNGLRSAYDSVGRLTQLTDYDNSMLSYIYDDSGNVLTMNDYHSNATTYTYNDIGQLSTLTAPGSKTWTYNFDGYSRLTKVDIPNGIATEYGFDSQGRRTKIHHKDGSTVKQGFDYEFDDGGNITKITHEDGASWAYEYDGRERLTSAVRSNTSSPTIDATYEYTYDDG